MIPPKKTAIFVNERFMVARHDEGCYEKKNFIRIYVFLFVLNGNVGVARSTVFEEIRPGAGFKTSDFVKELLAGGLCCKDWFE